MSAAPTTGPSASAPSAKVEEWLIGASGSWPAAGSRTGAGHWSSLNPRRCWVGIGRAGRPIGAGGRAGPVERGRCPIGCELRWLIRRMAVENHLWGQRRIQAELARLGFTGLGSHCRQIHALGTPPGTITQLAKLSQTACGGDLGLRLLLRPDPMVPNPLCLFRDPSRKPRSGAYPGDPASDGGVDAQQILECCGWDRKPPRFLIHDRDSRYGALFDRRLQSLGITQIRIPFRAPQANSIAERWVRSVRQECLEQTFIFDERHLRQVLAEYVAYFKPMAAASVDRPTRPLAHRLRQRRFAKAAQW